MALKKAIQKTADKIAKSQILNHRIVYGQLEMKKKILSMIEKYQKKDI